MLMTHQESAELAEPGVGSFDDPAAFVPSELSAVFVAPVPTVLAIRHDEVDTAFCEPFEPNSQWKTLAVDQYHPLRSLAALGLTDCRAPFSAGAKLPSRNVSSHFSRPSPSSAPSSVRQASSHTSCSSHCFNRRQQVAG